VTTEAFEVTDGSGNTAQCSFTITVNDVDPPSITCPADLGVPCTDPSGTVVTFADPTASDNCTPPPTVSCSPASGDVFPSGATTTVNCTATDASGNEATCSFDVTVGGELEVEAVLHAVGLDSKPGSTREPLVGMVVGVYDKAEGSCARDECGGVSWREYACIVANCDAVAEGVTDSDGFALFVLPDGNYLVIGDDGTDRHLGVSVGTVECGDFVRKFLQRIIGPGGLVTSPKPSHNR
jgi:hypothetical protein